MPKLGVEKKDHSDILSIEEIVDTVSAAAKIGIKKVRVTGGEPLVKNGLIKICKEIKEISGIEQLAITTNGLLLEDIAEDLKAAGVDRVNISIDSLNAEKYHDMTRGGDLAKVFRSIDAAEKAGLTPIKLNVVLIGGFNDGEIIDFVNLTQNNPYEVRFIELMPIGESLPIWDSSFLPSAAVLKAAPTLAPVENSTGGGVAAIYKMPGAAGTVGLINTISGHFCQTCNRLRLTTDGMIKPCLHSKAEVSVKGLKGAQLENALKSAIAIKPENRGNVLSNVCPSGAGRFMNQIGG